MSLRRGTKHAGQSQAAVSLPSILPVWSGAGRHEPGLVPAICGHARPGVLLVVPVLSHHAVASDVKLSRGSNRHQMSTRGLYHSGLDNIHTCVRTHTHTRTCRAACESRGRYTTMRSSSVDMATDDTDNLPLCDSGYTRRCSSSVPRCPLGNPETSQGCSPWYRTLSEAKMQESNEDT